MGYPCKMVNGRILPQLAVLLLLKIVTNVELWIRLCICHKALSLLLLFFSIGRSSCGSCKRAPDKLIALDKRRFQAKILFLHERICCGYSLEAHRRGTH